MSRSMMKNAYTETFRHRDGDRERKIEKCYFLAMLTRPYTNDPRENKNNNFKFH